MEVFAWQQLRAAFFQPSGPSHGLTFRAMPIDAGIVGVALVAALITLFEMASQCGCAAGLDGAQHALLRWRQRSSMHLAILVAMGAHNVSQFESWPHQHRTA
jgi:hypothetical protein